MADPTNISEQEEFEFRARAEAEAKAAEDKARADQEEAKAEELKSKAEAHPVSPEGVQHYGGEAADWLTHTGIPYAYGAGKAGAELASEHPLLSSALGYGAAAKFAPELSKWNTIKGIGQGALDVGTAFVDSRNAQALGQLEHQVRQYQKAGQAVPEQLQQAVERVRGKVAGPAPAPAPTAAPVVPEGPIVRAPVAPAPVAQAAESIPQQIQKFAAEKVLGPLGEAGQAIMRHPLINNPVTRFVASKPVQGALMAIEPGNSGQNYGAHFPMVGPMRGSEINPNTGRPWTQQELAAYAQQYGR